LELRGVEAGLLPPIYFSMGAEEEQTVYQLFSESNVLVYNCKDDIFAAASISGIQVIHSFYKHLVKLEVTKIRDILARAQKYIQIEDATRGCTNCSPKQGAN